MMTSPRPSGYRHNDPSPALPLEGRGTLYQGERGNKFPGKSYQQIGLKTSLFIGFPIKQQLTPKITDRMAYIGKTREPAFQYDAGQTSIDFAKNLRRKTTHYEKVLWQHLRKNQIAGCKFRRQHPIKCYVADFYCHESRLVIEVDGPIHDKADRKEYDLQRNGIMEDLGILTLRFSNDQIRYHLKQVLKKIKEYVIIRKSK